MMNPAKRRRVSSAAEQSAESSSECTVCTVQSETTDAGGFQRANSRQVDVEETNENEDTFAPKLPEYEISYPIRGTAVIIDEYKFNGHLLSCRKGSAEDANGLHKVFKKLGFSTILSFTNVPADEIMEKLKAVSKQHDSDIFLCAILTHGEEGIIHAIDRSIKVDEVLDLFDEENCPALAEKPKIFFIQACRGSETDDGIHVTDTQPPPDSSDGSQDESDANPISSQNLQLGILNSRPDMLIACPTIYGHCSFRNVVSGAVFIQKLCMNLENFHATEDLLSILTRVSCSVAMEYESQNDKNPYFDKKKQMPTIYSTFTKLLRFKHEVVCQKCSTTTAN